MVETTSSNTRTERIKLVRKRDRGSHERSVIDAILDDGLLAHLGFCDGDGQPVVIPTLHVRHNDVVYLHGSAASRALGRLATGAPACLTVSLLDGLVLARAAMHHSVNYRSVMLFGEARLLSDPHEKLVALRGLVERIAPGRWEQVRPPSENELKATAVLELPIVDASAKIRTGPPIDDEADLALSAWAGVLPLGMHVGDPQPDPLLRAAIDIPPSVSQRRWPALGC